ncbi:MULTISPECIES: HlyD family secretion protein [Lysobacter]|uniref:HlyD family secretion protein n=1 Tax=Lysobacter TaxID=68 RepID=UPI001F2815D0|nr:MULTISPECIES: HlyD family efflux transporter periplasmic adaptor subunit [Lysobacter]UJB18949.1 HlyD family efflux transporter periplasmic adaptor subunit [Lysobacter capsici]UJQ27326.1 HlyD family efflux transporter periplasmic adaptor subunit [Lysobacter gummosus]
MKRLWAMLLLASSLPAAAAPLRVDGEVYARRTSALMPPSVERMWQFNITQLATDGAPVKRGQQVISFDSSDVIKQLTEKQSQLKEKHSELEKLDLELAERQRSERLATSEAQAALDKAQRKTQQPAELIAGIEYRKLVVARAQMERKMALAQRRETLSAEQRRQERRLLAAERAQLQADVDRLQRSLGALNVIAPRDGLMMHRSNFEGEKYDVGSQVWVGQTVAEIPDMSTLAVRAELPERDLQKVSVGAPVRIVVEGGAGSVLRGHIASVGRAVRSKSQVQPVPVLDLDVQLDDPRAPLRPGQAVRVEIAAPVAAKGVAR